MSRSSLYLDPPHVAAAFYLDRLAPEAALGRVCAHVAAAGATPTGALTVVRGERFPRFGMISDLARHLEDRSVELRGGKQLQEWKTLVGGEAPGAKVLRVGFEAPQVGGVTVEYQPVPDDAQERTLHPVAVFVSGALLSMPGAAALSKKERRQAQATAQFLTSVFQGVCEAEEPLYAGILVEDSLPTPPELEAGSARLGTELFVSRRLESAAPGLERTLASLFEQGFRAAWSTGSFLSGWGALNPQGLGVEAPAAVGTQAGRHLGRALSQLAR
ncbi:hypothetical protein D7Y23_30140 [Corallococcus sp. AB050B]|nr:hypothetical protein D7Y23_30140 [Corallococcus sp. AB050B]